MYLYRISVVFIVCICNNLYCVLAADKNILLSYCFLVLQV